MPSFRVELAPLPFEKIENICDAFGPNDTRFMDERVGTYQLQMGRQNSKINLKLDDS